VRKVESKENEGIVFTAWLPLIKNFENKLNAT